MTLSISGQRERRHLLLTGIPKFFRFLKRYAGLVIPPQLLKYITLVVVSNGKGRIKRDSPIIGVDGVVKTLEVVERNALVVVSNGIGRIKGNSSIIGVDGVVKTLEFGERKALVVVSKGIGRVKRNSLVIGVDGVVKTRERSLSAMPLLL